MFGRKQLGPSPEPPPGYSARPLHNTVLNYTLLGCGRCGAWVGNTDKHDAWHEQQETT